MLLCGLSDRSIEQRVNPVGADRVPQVVKYPSDRALHRLAGGRRGGRVEGLARQKPPGYSSRTGEVSRPRHLNDTPEDRWHVETT
jgi:hypothetical protein